MNVTLNSVLLPDDLVWRDEFEAAHADEYGPEGMRARGNPNGFDPSAHAVNFNPHPDPNVAPPRLVLNQVGVRTNAGEVASQFAEAARTAAQEVQAQMADQLKAIL